MKSSQTSAALAVATLVLTWSAAGYADDQSHGSSHGSNTSTQDTQQQQMPSGSSTTGTPGQTMTDVEPTETTPSTTTTQDASRAATTTTTQAAFDPNASAEQREEIRPNVRVLIPSALVFAGAYGTSAIIGGVNDRDADRKLLIPVAGPWVDLAERDCNNGNPCDREGLSKAVLVASGILQGIGVVGVVASFFIPEQRTVRSSAALKPHVNVLPVSLGRGAGLGAVGTF